MRLKIIIFILCLSTIWFIVIVQLNAILHHEESLHKPSFRLEHPQVRIDYFKRYYRPSIEEDPTNKIGENGKKVEIPLEEKEEQDKRFALHKFNELASSKISLIRKFPEKRRKSCFSRKYPLDLPTASVVIIYHNEAESTLLRTVHTAISRAPHHLIKEVVLVDDLSDRTRFPHLAQPLDEHFRGNIKIKIIRPRERVGLTVARLIGAKAATGDVLVFLDSHCEAADGWLEPLLFGVKNNPKAAITPVIEVISMDDFSISPSRVDVISVGIFTWKADFTWYTPNDQTSSDKILRSPTMAGGLFAIGRKFFFEIGGYDDKMTYWGGENLEISFRLWTCSEGVYSDPCSIVGHVFRKTSPHDMAKNSVLFNKLRTVETWMDEYKDIVYNKIGVSGYDKRAGSLAQRLLLRKKLRCKSFKWYMTNVAPSIRVPGKSGPIRNSFTNKCLDSVDNNNSGKPVRLYSCHSMGGNQAFEVDKKGLILFDELCLDLAEGAMDSKPTMYTCHFSGGNQKWQFLENGLIMHDSHKVCLKVHSTSDFLIVSNCDSSDSYQQFSYTFSD